MKMKINNQGLKRVSGLKNLQKILAQKIRKQYKKDFLGPKTLQNANIFQNSTKFIFLGPKTVQKVKIASKQYILLKTVSLACLNCETPSRDLH